jgi:hypothetical protein
LQADLPVDFRESVLLEAVIHAPASARATQIAMLIGSCFLGAFCPPEPPSPSKRSGPARS